MGMPWVSRELYDRVLAELESVKQEKRELLDALLIQSGVAVPSASIAPAPPESPEDEERAFARIADSSTPSGLRKMAQEAAYAAAGRTF